MKRAEDIIIQPYITEKSNFLMSQGKYTFVVDKKATKIDVKKAVEELFGVKVLKVNIINCKGKKKRVGVHQGYTAAWKKSIVQIALNPGEESYLQKGGKKAAVDKKYKTEIEIFGTAQ
ncbi:MAG: 50S ribosomal protein L23 [Clostridiales bacterium]|nr:50S ribosomal protein L23 [Clostridiales bacterium]